MAHDKRLSRFLSLVLRHQPETLGLTLDAQGYAGVGELVRALRLRGYPTVTGADIEALVVDNDKQRFAFNEDKTLIRANQGHSVEVDLGLQPAVPPPVLYHGTAVRLEEPIRRQGILRMQRQHVHLSDDKITAHRVGSRHGTAIVFTIDAARMHADGFAFFRSENGVWLVGHVPAAYLRAEHDARR